MATNTGKFPAAEAKLLDKEGQDILLAVDYDNMEMFSSKTLGKTEAGVWTDANATAVFAGIYVRVTKNATGPAFEIFCEAGVFKISADDELVEIDFDIGTARAGAVRSPTYAGVEARLKLAGGSVLFVDANLGLGVSSGIGIKDDSLDAKLAGCGVTVGRKIGVSVFDNSFSIDLGKLGKFFYDAFTVDEEK